MESFKYIVKKDNLIKIDLHTHSNGISFCSLLSAKELLFACKQAGLQAIVLTNHYTSRLLSPSFTAPQFAVAFIREYELVKKEGEKLGITVLFGAEVAIKYPGVFYLDFLLYGVTPSQILQNPKLYEFSQKQLFSFCEKNNIYLVQAHPFRSEHNQIPANPKHMHAVEINCHSGFRYNLKNKAKKVLEFADKHNLGLTCGSDLHRHADAGQGGIYIPKSLKTEGQLFNYLKATKRPAILPEFLL